MNLTQEQIVKISLWQTTAEKLAELKEQEMAYRKAVIAEIFPQIEEGTTSVNLGNSGFRLVATQPLIYKVDGEMFSTIKDVLEEFGTIQVDELVRFKPELSTPVYKSLSGEVKALMETCVTITQGSCSLKIDKSKKKGL